MTFLSMLIALALHQLLQTRDSYPGDEPLLAAAQWAREQNLADGVSRLLVGAVPPLLLYCLLEVIDGWIFGLPTLALTAAVLLWALGREDYHTALEQCAVRHGRGDSQGAWHTLQELWIPPTGPQAPEDSELSAADTEQATREECEERLVYCGYQRWFAPLFYFLLLGPVAAAFYRWIYLLSLRRQERWSEVLWFLDWIPSRLLALSFAVTGDFVSVVAQFKVDESSGSPPLLRGAALASTGDSSFDPRRLGDLLFRTSGLWLLLAALVILIF